jgi:hypothetical protein
MAAIGIVVIPAQATVSNPSVTVTVADDLHGLVGGAQVTAYEQSNFDPSWNYHEAQTTSSAGTVTFTNLDSASHFKFFVNIAQADPGQVNNDAGGWINGANSPTLVPDSTGAADVITASSAISIPITLAVGNVASGTALLPDNSVLVGGSADVSAYRLTSNFTTSTPELDYVARAQVAGDGSYTLPGLQDGSYYFRLDDYASPADGFAQITYNAAGVLAQGRTDGLTAVDVHGAVVQSVQLAAASYITGTVSANPALSGIGSGITVYANPVNDNGTLDTTSLNGIAQDQANVDLTNGSYSIALVPGKYKVQFYPYNVTNSYPQWYNNAYDSSTATTVTVGAGGTTTGIDAALTNGFTLKGTVTAGNGHPVAGVTVAPVGTLNFQDVTPVVTAADGSYEFDNLAPDAYQIEFNGQAAGYPDVYLSSGPHGSPNITDAVTVGSVSDTQTVNFDYRAISTLTVHLANKAGAPIKGATIYAESVVAGQPVYDSNLVISVPVVGKIGSYSIAGLAIGDPYTLEIFPSTSTKAEGYFPQYLGGSPVNDPADAEAFVATDPTQSLDVTVQAAAAIGGTVTSASGVALKGVGVFLYRFDGTYWNEIDQISTSSTGKYSYPNEPVGSYKLEFFAGFGVSGKYTNSYNGGASTLDQAKPLYVKPGSPLTVNAKLSTGGSISGVLKAPDGSTQFGYGVTAYRLSGTPGAFTSSTIVDGTGGETGTGGKYTVTGLASGYYALSFSQGIGPTSTYGDAFDPAHPGAHYVKVTAGKSVSAGTSTLTALGSAATGIVNGQIVGGPSNATGTVSFSSSDYRYNFALSINSDGSFSGALVPGTYTYSVWVNADSSGTTYEPEVGTITIAAGANAVQVVTRPTVPLSFTTLPVVSSPGSSTEVGTTFTVDAAWTRASTAYVQYQWLRDGHAIFGATGTSYTAVGGDAGSTIAARVLVQDYTIDISTIVGVAEIGGDGTVAPSTALASDSSNLPSISPSGVAFAGQTLTASPGQWGVSGATFAYQWYLDATPISGARSRTYKTLLSQAHHGITVTVSATKPGYVTPPVATSGDVIIDDQLGLHSTISPVVTAKKVGGLTQYSVSTGSWSVAGVTYEYLWRADGSGIFGAESKTYTPAAGNEAITVDVSAVKPGYVTAQKTVLARRGINTNIEPAPDVYVGTTQVTSDTQPVKAGESLTVDPHAGQWSAVQNQRFTFGYKWERQTGSTWAAITGATKSAYTASTSDVGHKLKVIVSTASPYYATRSFTQAAGLGTTGAPTNFAGQAGMSYTGTFQPGTTVSAKLSEFPTGETYTYQWQNSLTSVDSDFADIAGATKSSYVIHSGDAEKYLRVVVTATHAGAHSTAISVSQQVLDLTTLATVSPARLSGSGAVGTTLTLDPGVWNIAGATYSYQWYRGDIAIPGVTGTTYSPIGSSLGDEISVVVHATRKGYTSGTATTNTVKVIAGAQPTASTKPKITGTLSDGSTVAATTGIWSLDGLTFSYQWMAGTTPIAGATADTYLVDANDLCGASLSVVVTATRPGYLSGGSQSLAFGTLPSVC